MNDYTPTRERRLAIIIEVRDRMMARAMAEGDPAKAERFRQFYAKMHEIVSGAKAHPWANNGLENQPAQ